MKKFAVAIVFLGFAVTLGLVFHVDEKVTAQEIGPGPMSNGGTVVAQQIGPGPFSDTGLS